MPNRSSKKVPGKGQFFLGNLLILNPFSDLAQFLGPQKAWGKHKQSPCGPIYGGEICTWKPRLWQRAVVFFAPNKTFKRLGWTAKQRKKSRTSLDSRTSWLLQLEMHNVQKRGYRILDLMSPKHPKFLELNQCWDKSVWVALLLKHFMLNVAVLRRIEYSHFDEAACEAGNAWIEPICLDFESGWLSELAYFQRLSCDLLWFVSYPLSFVTLYYKLV